MPGFRRILFTKWNSKPLLLSLVALTASGCVSLAQPVGDWARPSDLGLDEKSLSGVKVSVRTGRLDKKGEAIERPLKIRNSLENALTAVGALVINAGSEIEPDLTLWYLERGVGESQSSYASEIAFLMTGGIVPWVSSRELGAELRVTDHRGIRLGEQSAKIVDVQAVGWLALIHVFNFSESGRSRRRQISRSFLRSAQNLVYSQSFRARLSKVDEAKAGGAEAGGETTP